MGSEQQHGDKTVFNYKMPRTPEIQSWDELIYLNCTSSLSMAVKNVIRAFYK